MNKQKAAPPAAVRSSAEDNLRRIDLRIRGLKANSPESPELARMQAAREDVTGRMSAAEIQAYERVMNASKSREQLLAEAEAERLAMDANKDKPPI